jgi:putative CocE/NonD family hydrolase
MIHETNVAVPMRDGVILRADLVRPAGNGPFPTLICRTPYGKDTDKDELRFVQKALKRGYAVMIQDVRGRFASEGEFAPHRNEGRDGYDTIEWVARQAWSDGRVGTFGLSYPGSVQWLAALEQPPHLKAMAPAMTYASLREAVYPGGIFDMDWARWALLAMAPDLRARKHMPGPKTGREAWADWRRRGTEYFQGHLPLLNQPDLTLPASGAPAFYAEWLRHPRSDRWWDFADMAGRYDRVTAAVLNLSGWHDDAFSTHGAIDNHLGLVAARKGQKDARTELVIGPWSHGIPAITGERDYGTRTFDTAAHLDYDALVLDFMDRHVRGLQQPTPSTPVRFFIMGENRWHGEAAWPPAGVRAYDIHLGPRREGSVVNRLSHATPAPGPSASSFVADPDKPVREIPGSDLGPTDQSRLTPGGDILLFQTRPLKRDMAVAGHIRAEIYVSTDAPDIDLYVKLLDVDPNGEVYNLMDSGAEVIRASLRDAIPGRRGAKHLLEPGRIYRLDLNSLLTANTFHKGDRIRVVLCASWYPGMARNLQTGKDEATSNVTRKAVITVHHDAEHPSRLILPVLP